MTKKKARPVEAQKPKMGRPRRAGEVADHPIRINVTAAEAVAFEKQAERDKSPTVSGWLRDLGRAAARLDR